MKNIIGIDQTNLINEYIQSVIYVEQFGVDRVPLGDGWITTSATFPTLAAVQDGYCYVCDSAVTDNDPTKTNTNQSFDAHTVIAWDASETRWIKRDGKYPSTSVPSVWMANYLLLNYGATFNCIQILDKATYTEPNLYQKEGSSIIGEGATLIYQAGCSIGNGSVTVDKIGFKVNGSVSTSSSGVLCYFKCNEIFEADATSNQGFITVHGNETININAQNIKSRTNGYATFYCSGIAGLAKINVICNSFIGRIQSFTSNRVRVLCSGDMTIFCQTYTSSSNYLTVGGDLSGDLNTDANPAVIIADVGGNYYGNIDAGATSFITVFENYRGSGENFGTGIIKEIIKQDINNVKLASEGGTGYSSYTLGQGLWGNNAGALTQGQILAGNQLEIAHNSTTGIPTIARRRSVVNNSGAATYNIQESQSGTLFKNTNATATITFRLPVATSSDKIGYEFSFFCDAANTFNVITYDGDGDYIYDEGTQKSVIHTSTVGNTLYIKCIAINRYAVISKLGTWT